MLRSQDLFVSYAIVCKVAVKKPQKFTDYKTTIILHYGFHLSSRSQSCTASPSIAEKHLSEGPFSWINPDKSKIRPSESSLIAEMSTDCCWNLSSSSWAYASPLPTAITLYKHSQNQRNKTFYCPQQTSFCPYGEQLVQIKWGQDRGPRWFPEENYGHS